PARDGGAGGGGGLADRGNRRAVLPADREVQGHRHARRHDKDRQGHAPGARLDSVPRVVSAGDVVTGSVVTGGVPVADRVLAAQIVVIAKEPVPGRVKTSLTPPFTPAQAAALAEASLADTLAAVADTAVARRVLA